MKVRSNKWILLNSSKLSLFLFSKYLFTRTVLRSKISSKKYCLNFGIYTKLQMGRGVDGLVEYKRNQFSQRFYSIHLFRSHIGVGGRGELCKVMHNHNQRLFFFAWQDFLISLAPPSHFFFCFRRVWILYTYPEWKKIQALMFKRVSSFQFKLFLVINRFIHKNNHEGERKNCHGRGLTLS